MAPDVDLVVNCYEGTYRTVLDPGFVASLAANQKFSFSTVTVLINNVDDRSDAEEMAARLLARSCNRVDRVEWVADHLPEALLSTGLTARHLRRIPFYTDWALVAVTLPGHDWMLHWDAQCVLSRPCDWISPTILRMSTSPELVVGNPAFCYDGLAEREASVLENDFAIGYGFSDQVFLVRRRQFARPIYRYNAPAAWRGPLSHVSPIFEQRVDAWMRRTGRCRATFRHVSYTHDAEFGSGYPELGVRERLRRRMMAAAARAARMSPHPAMRAWPDVTSP